MSSEPGNPPGISVRVLADVSTMTSDSELADAQLVRKTTTPAANMMDAIFFMALYFVSLS